MDTNGIAALEIDGLEFSYPHHKIIDGLNLTVPAGGFISVAGVNGAGKSTLFKLILRELVPDGGSVKLFGQAAAEFDRWPLVGYMPQLREFNSGFPATVWEVVCTGLYGLSGAFKRPSKQHYAAAEQALRTVGMGEYKNRLIGKLSGGQQQRVLLARVLCSGARLLLLDEPTTGLDPETARLIFKLLKDLSGGGVSVLMVTHDPAAELYASSAYTLCCGKLIRGGKIAAHSH